MAMLLHSSESETSNNRSPGNRRANIHNCLSMPYKYIKRSLLSLFAFTLVFIYYSDLFKSSGSTVAVSSTIRALNHSKFLVNFLNSTSSTQLDSCFYQIPKKNGYINDIKKEVLPFEEIEKNLKKLSIMLVDGGKSLTELNSQCEKSAKSLQNIAFIIPYRNRSDNLRVFLNNMHPYLTKQKINYGIYLIESVENVMFNRALLMNIGFLESQKDVLKPLSFDALLLANGTNETAGSIPPEKSLSWNCFVFHDVDM
jgi:hypothetical protein